MLNEKNLLLFLRLLQDPEFSDKALRLYLILICRATQTGSFNAQNLQLQTDLNLNTIQLEGYIKELENKGLITVVGNAGDQNQPVYYLQKHQNL